MTHTYLLALGSNQRHAELGNPRQVVAAAMEELAALGTVSARSPVVDSAPVGPSLRRYANAALVLETDRWPPALLAVLQAMEHDFGRRRRGQRWGARVLDLDIVLWSGGEWQTHGLAIPHPQFRHRAFVLRPGAVVAGDWRDPVSGLTLRHLAARLDRTGRLA
ncbi:2-amino-4-hydroxy-6-hydroxymethyldihydropteridine diphosphokinase [Croceibacterium sp. TMG7-5b_MA50]|uniref:2-amino-4-hydroxy-6- hydroxymethyldihydropteridine diphosphokinase n=1 Tax=Croceibacterium sp. TMG7-5b_MA50 TaxID=3121290 RepID=UPI0032216F82